MSGNGCKYYLSIVDDNTRFTWIFPLKVKSQAFEAFKYFKVQAEKQLGKKIKSLQTDGGGEFQAFTNFVKEQGIIHRLSCPHTHYQNGRV